MGGGIMVKSRSDMVFLVFVYAFLLGAVVVVIFPLLFVISSSITPYSEVIRNGGFIVIPRQVTFSAYAELLERPDIPRSLRVTVFITVIGTACNLILTILMAYPLSKKHIPGRKLFIFLVVFTMLFSGGLIPTYLIVKSTGLINKVWAMIVPNMVSAFFLMIMKNFFENIPQDLFEQAYIDGAGETQVLLRIVLPLSRPVMATVGLFYMVSHWNELFQAIFYISRRNLYPIQVIIREILIQSRAIDNVDITIPTFSLQMASIIVASAPIIAVYPFLQKHFVKGMLLGSIKG
jgi:putative aldouronate transport system permease protein